MPLKARKKKAVQPEEVVIQTLTGEQWLAQGLRKGGIEHVVGVAGVPGADLMKELLDFPPPSLDTIEWSVNGKSACEQAVGASLAGRKAAVVLRSCDLLPGLDILVASCLTGVRGALVVLCGDDPGNLFWHRRPDPRSLCHAVNLPVIEPSTHGHTPGLVAQALQWSQIHRLPIIIRYTAGFSTSEWEGPIDPPSPAESASRTPIRNLILLAHVSEKYSIWRQRLSLLRKLFEESESNLIQGEGKLGIVAPGYIYQKLMDVGNLDENPQLRVLGLSCLFPLPKGILERFLSGLERVLVLEEGEPLLETLLRGLLGGEDGSSTKINGRQDGFVPADGELPRWRLLEILAEWDPHFQPSGTFLPFQEQQQPFFSEGICEGCYYADVFQALKDVLEEMPDESPPPIFADPGCPMRGALPPWEALNGVLTAGSSIAVATGVSRASGGQKVIAIVGDASFFHSEFNSLIDAVTQAANILILILDNGISAQTGFQPSPSSGKNAQNQEVPRRDIEDFLLAAKVPNWKAVNVDNFYDIKTSIRKALSQEGPVALIMRKPCYLFVS